MVPPKSLFLPSLSTAASYNNIPYGAEDPGQKMRPLGAQAHSWTNLPCFHMLPALAGEDQAEPPVSLRQPFPFLSPLVLFHCTV